MFFTQPTNPRILKDIIVLANNSVIINYTSGESISLNNVNWSTAKSPDIVEEDLSVTKVTDGVLHISQSGSSTSMGILGAKVSVDNPLTFNGMEYTDIETLTEDMVSVLT